ncbi:hypothetical protein [Williamsia phyllosphaerae]|uniref:Uncharacterized protein n=1 Tax=Williamsia phyllosphaerae TaxID=885042 RepID=A0ABQ1V001_9NOCA|nr:hypothetical protein [Williamsia phyllosphaerae]GGF32363.1 hypothetical protein GCM10007298_30270 [Williamsia phyllosphaerae]
MTTRAAALAGLQYFTDVRAIATQVGVVVPEDAVIAARFAATDSIDLAALAADAAMLDDVVVTLRGTADTAHDVRRGLTHVWHGDAADAADAAVGTHLRSARDVADGVRTVSATIAAAATALGRVQEEKHRTLAILRTDSIAGQSMSTISVEDIAADPEPCRADITAATELFTRTMDVVDAAAASILTALTESFRALPAPREIGPPHRPGSTHRSTPRRDPRARRRTDIVVTPTPGSGSGRGAPDTDVVVAAISAGATIAGAALAAASSVGTAVAGGVSAVMTHLIGADAVDGDERAITPVVPRRAEPEAPATERPSRTTDPSEPTAVAPVPPAPQPPGGVEPSSPSVRLIEPEVVPPVPGVRAPDASDTPSPDPAEVLGVPSVGPRQRDREPSRGRPDPDDSGGLALAGDR